MDQPLNPDYTRHHPKWYRRRMPIFWWVRKYRYFRFIARELTCLAVGYAAALLMVQVWALARGPDALAAFEAWLRTPAATALNGVVFLALAFHAVTWFNLAPRALALRLGGRRLPDRVVLVAHYAAWVTVSGLVGWVLAGGG